MNGLENLGVHAAPVLQERRGEAGNRGGLPGWLAGVRSADVASLGLLILLGFLTYGRELLLGWMPMDMDILVEGIPAVAWLGQVARSGESPLWVPGVLGGFPLAFGQYSFFDPVHWVAAVVLDPNRATALVRIVYLAAAGTAAYGFGRVLGLSPIASLLAAAGYQLSTEAVAMPAYGNGVQSLLLLPTLLLAVELTVRRGIRWASLGAAAVGLSMAAGGAYVTGIGLLSGGLYTLARVVFLWKDGLRRKSALLALSTGAAVALGVGLAAFRVLPTMAITAESVRSNGMSLAAAAAGSPGVPGLLAGYLLPLSRLADLGNQGEYNAPGYVGPAILILAILALRGIRRSPWVGLLFGLALFNLLASLGDTGPVFGFLHDLPGMGFFRGPQRFSTASALFLGLLAALALDNWVMPGTPGHRAPVRARAGETPALPAPTLDPPPDRHNRRAWLMVAAALATVAAVLTLALGALWLYGGDMGTPLRQFAEANRLGGANPLRPRMALALAALPATLWLLWAHREGRLGRSTLGCLCVALTAGLLLVANLSVTVRQPEPSDAPPTARFLQQDDSLFRVMSHTSSITLNNYLVLLAGGNLNRVDAEGPRELDFRYRYMVETLTSNLALQYGLHSVDGQGLLQSIRQTIALSYLGSGSSDLSDFEQIDQGLAARLWEIRHRHLLEHLPVLRAFNVKYVLSNFDWSQHPDLLRPVFTSSIPMLDPRTLTNVYVYEVIGTLPRAYLVPDSASTGSAAEALDALLAGRIDPARTVLLEQPALPLAEPRLDPGCSYARVTSYGNTELSLEAWTDGSGFLVLNDAFHPGWQAWVDGDEVPIRVANGWVRAVPVRSPGSHAIRFAYRPPLFDQGIWISLASLGLLLAALVVPWARGNRRS